MNWAAHIETLVQQAIEDGGPGPGIEIHMTERTADAILAAITFPPTSRQELQFETFMGYPVVMLDGYLGAMVRFK